ncbi:zinc finger BED domain-containing protein RICESLEEPER 2-like [Humulus lupulus]|uniref:zinc finger BED domain-containing protein RICESLEEPER 2-like n=1 Tax=Humulus lupulus TaxID=3486 RepID=UPI002B401953|nr:zinc finger BED domain-containing protein RICESLEEPER 2-like [Humulus lupulus]
MVDNASSNDVANGERLKEKHESIAAITNVVRYVRSSPSRLITFKKCMKEEGIECKGLLCLDVQTRWNSTFLMLNCALKFRKAFERMEGNGNYSKYFNEADKDGKPKEGPPSEKHWQDALVFLNDLTLDDEEDELLHCMAKNMKHKYDKYWGKLDECNEALLIALVLDPRYKLDYLHHCFGDIHDDVTCTMMSQSIVSGSSSYVMSAQPTTSSTSNKSKRSHNLHDEYVARKMEKEGGKTKNKVDKYLEEAVELPSQNFDVLGWWASSGCKYKIFSIMARDVLAIPVTTVASEAAFSTGGRILDPFRSSLSPRMVEALICLKNWWSDSHQPIIVRDYIDEAEVLQTSDDLESDMMTDASVSSVHAPFSVSASSSAQQSGN